MHLSHEGDAAGGMGVPGRDEGPWKSTLESQIDPFALLVPVRDDVGVITDLRYVEVNAAAVAYHRIRRSELVGRTMLDFYPGLAANGPLKQYIATVETGFPTILDDIPYDNEVLGERRWYDIRAVRSGDAVALTWRDITDRHALLAAVTESEARYRMLVDNVYGIGILSVAGLVQWISPAVVDLLGWAAEEMVGRTTLHLWHPDDLAAALDLRDHVYAGTPQRGVLRIRHRDGHFMSVEVMLQPHTDDDSGAPGSVTWMRDVTAQVEAERALAEREEQFRLLAENAADIVFRSDVAGALDWVSPSVAAVLGWDPAELLGTSFKHLLLPEDLPRLYEAASHAPSGEAVTYEARLRHRDGSAVWMSVSARSILAADGTVLGRVGGLRLIQEEVEAREAKKLSEALLNSALQSAAIGIAMIDLDGRYRLVNPAWCAMLQREESWLLAHRNLDVLHPDDRTLFIADRDLMMAGGGDVQVRDLRFVRADGTVLWSRRTAVLIRDSAGDADYILLEIEDLTAEYEARAELTYQAFHDGLTGLRNRAWILDIMETELLAAEQRANPVGVLFIDVDNFKLVNDSLSHAAGDEVLQVVARRITQVMDPVDHVGRFGGDEFVVVVPDAAGPLDLERVAARICGAVAQDLVVDGHRIVPTVSIGISLSTAGSTAAGLLRDTDSALFRAKESGRARWHFFDDAMHAQAINRLTLEDEIRNGIPAEQFVVHFQPVVDLPHGPVVGHEALVRWRHPARGLVSPAEFLPVAEDSGLIVGIGDLVLDSVCRLLAARPDLPGPIAVNVSGVQLTRPDAVRAFTSALERHAVDPHRIVLEVTETAVLSIGERTRADLYALRASGVGIHVDDFGTGFSSISLLRDLPVSGLKLDMRFVRDLTEGASPANALAAGLAGLADGLGLMGIAEGIETAEQARLLSSLGWRHGQGYFFGRPAPEPAVG
ncbi:MAG: EAL domain-containing protein [Cellulomonadaceae bacterium]|nr:EAL domain-containing protein [Cellulomonadaceae bacterium]